jgi:hypothetical protein
LGIIHRDRNQSAHCTEPTHKRVGESVTLITRRLSRSVRSFELLYH